MDDGEKIAALARTPLFSALSREPLETLAGRAVPHRLVRSQVLFLAGETAAGVYVVASGAVRSVREAAGRRQLLSLDGEGSVLGELPVIDGGVHSSTAIASGRTLVFFLANGDLRRVAMGDPAFLCRALEAMTARARRYADLIELLSFHDVNRRLAWFLAAECRRRGPAFELTATHSEIAAAIGTVREVVTRAFAALQNQGLLGGAGRLVEIPDEDALARYARAEPVRPRPAPHRASATAPPAAAPRE